MPENPSTQPAAVPSGALAPAEQRSLAAPVILRAVVALAFGAVTVFWGTPTAAGAAWCLAAYFVGLAAARAWLLREEGRAADPAARPTAAVRLVSSACFGLAAAVGLGLGAAPGGGVIAAGGAAALALTGLADLVAAIVGRGGAPWRGMRSSSARCTSVPRSCCRSLPAWAPTHCSEWPAARPSSRGCCS
ncbi:hypothetical protein [Sinomonas atrocyanea]